MALWRHRHATPPATRPSGCIDSLPFFVLGCFFFFKLFVILVKKKPCNAPCRLACYVEGANSGLEGANSGLPRGPTLGHKTKMGPGLGPPAWSRVSSGPNLG